MKGYVLLRKNKQEGPYSLSELVSKNLNDSDLIWKVGESSKWLYSYEIEELKSFVNSEIDEQKVRERQIRLHKAAIHVLGLMAAVLSGLLIVSAVSVNKLPNNIISTNQVPVKLSASTFTAPALPEGSVPDQPINKNIQNALVTEIITAESKEDHKSKMLDHLKKQITIAGNDYSTGKKGGIRNLYLTIENKSYILLKNVRVQVDYLNSVGRIINSQVITIKNVPARGEKSWKMMDANKGEKVQYKILDIFSRKEKTFLFEA